MHAVRVSAPELFTFRAQQGAPYPHVRSVASTMALSRMLQLVIIIFITTYIPRVRLKLLRVQRGARHPFTNT